MSDLYPTKMRLALLAEVADHRIVGRAYDAYSVITGRKVAASMREMETAGWVVLAGGERWRLTDAGRAVLDGAS